MADFGTRCGNLPSDVLSRENLTRSSSARSCRLRLSAWIEHAAALSEKELPDEVVCVDQVSKMMYRLYLLSLSLDISSSECSPASEERLCKANTVGTMT